MSKQVNKDARGDGFVWRIGHHGYINNVFEKPFRQGEEVQVVECLDDYMIVRSMERCMEGLIDATSADPLMSNDRPPRFVRGSYRKE